MLSLNNSYKQKEIVQNNQSEIKQNRGSHYILSNFFLSIPLLFIIIYIVLYVGIFREPNNNLINNKIFVFLNIALLQLLVHIVNHIQSSCEIKISKIGKSSIYTGILGVVGISIYADLIILKYITTTNNLIRLSILTFIIVSLITIEKVIKIATLDKERCDNIM